MSTPGSNSSSGDVLGLLADLLGAAWLALLLGGLVALVTVSHPDALRVQMLDRYVLPVLAALMVVGIMSCLRYRRGRIDRPSSNDGGAEEAE